MQVIDQTKKEVRKQAFKYTGKMQAIFKHISKKGNPWYTVQLDGNELFAVSDKQYQRHEQLFSDLEPGQEVCVTYLSSLGTNNIVWRNLIGLSADFSEKEDLPF